VVIVGRRVFLLALVGALARPRAVASQQSAASARRQIARVGVLLPGSRPAGPSPFEQGLRELGWVEGRSARFERRYADWQAERLRELAAELVGLEVDVILATNLQAAGGGAAGQLDAPHRHARGERPRSRAAWSRASSAPAGT